MKQINKTLRTETHLSQESREYRGQRRVRGYKKLARKALRRSNKHMLTE